MKPSRSRQVITGAGAAIHLSHKNDGGGASKPKAGRRSSSSLQQYDMDDAGSSALQQQQPRVPPTVFAFGYNGHGQCGTGDYNDRSAPRPVRGLVSAGIQAQLVSCGSMHSILVDQHGGAWAWGSNSHGQLGTGGRSDRAEPARITCDGQRVIGLAAGGTHTLLCTSRGRAFACGSNATGQLGLPHDDPAAVAYAGSGDSRTLLVPTVVAELLGTRIVAVAAGFAHSTFLSRPGGVFCCGAGEVGQCGNGRTQEVNDKPAAVSALEPVACAAIACGNFHSAALARDDEGLYTWGEGKYGRLGHGGEACESAPRLVAGLLGVRVARVACGGACTCCIDEMGGLWTWGSNSWGQCGHGSGAGSDAFEPRKLAALDGVQVRECSCAEDHMLALTQRGDVLSWGRTCNGRLGTTQPYDVSSQIGLTTPALEATATASALARASTPNGLSRAAPHASGTVLYIKLPYLEGLSGLDGGRAGGDDHADHGSLAMLPPQAPLRVTSVCCGGAHSTLLCSQQPDGLDVGSPTRSARKSKRPAVATQCVLESGASGLGSSLQAVAGKPLTVQLIARDAKGMDCTLAESQRFEVALHRVAPSTTTPSPSSSSSSNGARADRGRLSRASAADVDTPTREPTLTSLGGGVYAVELHETRAGAYRLHAMLTDGSASSGGRHALDDDVGSDDAGDDEKQNQRGALKAEHVSGSPASLSILPAEVSPPDCRLTGTCVRSGRAEAGERMIVTIAALDRFGNLLRKRPAGGGGAGGANGVGGGAGGGTLPFEVMLVKAGAGAGRTASADSTSASLADMGDGTYQAALSPRLAGRFALFCKLRGEAVGDSPYFVDVGPGPPAASKCAVQGLNADEQRAVGEQVAFRITAADEYGNVRPDGVDRFAVQVSGPMPFPISVTPSAEGRALYNCTGVPFVVGKYYISVSVYGGQRLPKTPIRLFCTAVDDGPGTAVEEAVTAPQEAEMVAVPAVASPDISDPPDAVAGEQTRSSDGDGGGRASEGGERTSASDDDDSGDPQAYNALRELLRGATLEVSGDGITQRSGIEGEVSKVSVALLPAGDAGVDFARAALPHAENLPALRKLLRCSYSGADNGVATLVSVSSAASMGAPSPRRAAAGAAGVAGAAASAAGAAAGAAGAVVCHFEYQPRSAGFLSLRAELLLGEGGQPASDRAVGAEASASGASPRPGAASSRPASARANASPPSSSQVRVRVFAAAPWNFYQLGVLSTASPSARLPPLFYDLVPPTPASMLARPFALLEELMDTPVDSLPAAILVDVATDASLAAKLDEARLLLQAMPLPARVPMLALLVSSWLGGHIGTSSAPAKAVKTAKDVASSGEDASGGGFAPAAAAEEVLEDRRWREQHGTNVRPLGSIRRGGQRPRALLFKLVFDEVLRPMAGGMGGACELRRARSGRLECWVQGENAQGGAAPAGTGGGDRVLVELYS